MGVRWGEDNTESFEHLFWCCDRGKHAVLYEPREEERILIMEGGGGWGHRRLFRGDDPELNLEGTLGLNQVGMWKEGRGKNDIPDREPVCVKTEQWEKAW